MSIQKEQGCHSSQSFKFPDLFKNSFHWLLKNETIHVYNGSTFSFASHWYCYLKFQSLQSLSEENVLKNRAENLLAINRKMEFPDFSLTMPLSKIFSDFLKNSLTFPRPWKNFRFYLTVATLWKETQYQQNVNGIVIGIIHKCFFLIYEHLTHH